MYKNIFQRLKESLFKQKRQKAIAEKKERKAIAKAQRKARRKTSPIVEKSKITNIFKKMFKRKKNIDEKTTVDELPSTPSYDEELPSTPSTPSEDRTEEETDYYILDQYLERWRDRIYHYTGMSKTKMEEMLQPLSKLNQDDVAAIMETLDLEHTYWDSDESMVEAELDGRTAEDIYIDMMEIIQQY